MSQIKHLSPVELIQQSNQAFMAAFQAGNAATVAQLYTQQGQLFPAHTGPIRGRAAIQAFWQGAMDLGIKQANLKTVEVEPLEDTLIEVGEYTLCGFQGQTLDQGKYLVVWKLIGDKYFLSKDIWTTSLPAAPSTT